MGIRRLSIIALCSRCYIRPRAILSPAKRSNALYTACVRSRLLAACGERLRLRLHKAVLSTACCSGAGRPDGDSRSRRTPRIPVPTAVYQALQTLATWSYRDRVVGGRCQSRHAWPRHHQRCRTGSELCWQARSVALRVRGVAHGAVRPCVCSAQRYYRIAWPQTIPCERTTLGRCKARDPPAQHTTTPSDMAPLRTYIPPFQSVRPARYRHTSPSRANSTAPQL
ncbi:hypothetical protein BD413DRAFT_289289 [Trametes elegans]|nr:hypothetical protein BD413DRAFT_289289 [Trametes elegans]